MGLGRLKPGPSRCESPNDKDADLTKLAHETQVQSGSDAAKTGQLSLSIPDESELAVILSALCLAYVCER